MPVVHTKEIWPWQRGFYMYYARGCSDVMWDPGRTVAASNRLQLAVKLTRLQLGCNRSTAHGLVTRFLRTSFQVGGGDHWRSLGRLLGRDELCAHCSVNASWNAHPGKGHPCSEGIRFAGDGGLDAYSLPLMQQLGFDSAQLIFQPAGNTWTHIAHTELWDVRNASKSSAVESDRRSFSRNLRCRGEPCVPSGLFAQCKITRDLCLTMLLRYRTPRKSFLVKPHCLQLKSIKRAVLCDGFDVFNDFLKHFRTTQFLHNPLTIFPRPNLSSGGYMLLLQT